MAAAPVDCVARHGARVTGQTRRNLRWRKRHPATYRAQAWRWRERRRWYREYITRAGLLDSNLTWAVSMVQDIEAPVRSRRSLIRDAWEYVFDRCVALYGGCYVCGSYPDILASQWPICDTEGQLVAFVCRGCEAAVVGPEVA